MTSAERQAGQSRRVCILTLTSDSLTFTLASAIAYAGHRVEVWVADLARDKGTWSRSAQLTAVPGVTVMTDPAASPSEHIDRLIIQGNPHLPRHTDKLARLAANSTALTVISAGDRNRSYLQALRLQWHEWRCYGRWSGKIERVAYKDGYYPLDWFGLFRTRTVVGFDAHSKFLLDEGLFHLLHAPDWQPETARPIRVNFVGSRDPQSRSRILDRIATYFTSGVTPSGQRMLWHAYTDAQPMALSPETFIQVLTDSDFTLAPRGYSRVTHRPVEALLRGSIPVLQSDELDLYDLGLADGVNCIAVAPGGWPKAMERIMRLPHSEVSQMRRHIRSMLAERVDYPAIANAMCHRLGLDAHVQIAARV